MIDVLYHCEKIKKKKTERVTEEEKEWQIYRAEK